MLDVISWVVSVVLQKYVPELALEVKVTLSPSHNVVGPSGVMVGVAGMALICGGVIPLGRLVMKLVQPAHPPCERSLSTAQLIAMEHVMFGPLFETRSERGDPNRYRTTCRLFVCWQQVAISRPHNLLSQRDMEYDIRPRNQPEALAC